MAKTETFTASNEAAARFAAELDDQGRHPAAPYGPICTVNSTTVEMYSGNGTERARLAAILSSYETAASTSDRSEASATVRQIAFLNNLRYQDPAFATTVGMPADLASLTKSRASALIDMMLSNR